MARPTKYKPEYCEQLIEHMSQGYPLDTFAALIHVNIDTLYAWRDAHPEFSEAIKDGRAKSMRWMIDFGRSAMAGKIANSQNSIWIFMMKNMYHWRDRSEIEHSGGSKPIKFENLTDEDIQQRTKAALKILGIKDDREE